jgi:hypothetical protein
MYSFVRPALVLFTVACFTPNRAAALFAETAEAEQTDTVTSLANLKDNLAAQTKNDE